MTRTPAAVPPFPERMEGEGEPDAWGNEGERETCMSCGGSGTEYGETCLTCGGYGWTRTRLSITREQEG